MNTRKIDITPVKFKKKQAALSDSKSNHYKVDTDLVSQGYESAEREPPLSNKSSIIKIRAATSNNFGMGLHKNQTQQSLIRRSLGSSQSPKRIKFNDETKYSKSPILLAKAYNINIDKKDDALKRFFKMFVYDTKADSHQRKGNLSDRDHPNHGISTS